MSEAFLLTTAQLYSDNSDLCVASLHVMGILGSRAENQQKMVEMDLVPVFIALIDGGTDDQSLAAIQTLGNLAQSATVQEIAGKSGAVAKIAPFLQHHSDKMRRVAAGALGNLAINEPNCQRIHKAGAIPWLVDLLSSRVYPGADATTAETAVGALRNLLVDVSMVDELIDANIMKGLVELMKTGNEESRETAGDLLAFLSQQEVAELPGHDLHDDEL